MANRTYCIFIWLSLFGIGTKMKYNVKIKLIRLVLGLPCTLYKIKTECLNPVYHKIILIIQFDFFVPLD